MKEKITIEKDEGEFRIDGSMIFAPDAVIMLGQAMRAIFNKFDEDGIMDMETCLCGAVKYCLGSEDERADYIEKSKQMFDMCKNGDEKGVRELIKDTFSGLDTAEVN